MSLRMRLRQKATVEPFKGYGSLSPRFGPPVEVPCRVDDKWMLTIGGGMGAGLRVDRGVVVILPAGTDCPVDSNLTLPGGDAPLRTKGYFEALDGRGRVHHVEVTV